MSHKIMIVDDDVDALGIMSVKLKAHDYEICQATNGQEALDQLKSFHPDIILLDVMMPVMDGLETCQKIRAEREFTETPIIFVTARSEDWDLLKGYSLGCSSYLVKPIDTKMLLEEVQKALS